METKKQTQSKSKNNQAVFADPRAYLSKDREYLTLVLPNNVLIRKHVNYFKAIMEIPFTSKAKANQ